MSRGVAFYDETNRRIVLAYATLFEFLFNFDVI